MPCCKGNRCLLLPCISSFPLNFRVCSFVFCNIFRTENNRKDLAIYYSVKIELLFNLRSIAKIMAQCLEEIIEMPHVARSFV